MKEKQRIVLPKYLYDPAFRVDLITSLKEVAEVLDIQGRLSYADSVRDAATICDTFVKVNLTKTHELLSPTKSNLEPASTDKRA